MFATLALFGILGLPLFVGALQRSLVSFAAPHPGLEKAALGTAIGGALLSLIAAWIWWRLRSSYTYDVIIGGWSNVSFVGTPLAVSGSIAAACAVLALAVARVAQVFDLTAAMRVEAVTSQGILALGAGLALLGDTAPTLLIGIGLMNLAGVWSAARQQSGRLAMRAFGPQIIALLLISFVFTLHASNGDDRLHMMQIAASPLLVTILSASICLQANLLPFGATRDASSELQTTAGLLGALAILNQGSTPKSWVFALAAITCVYWSIRALGASDSELQHARIRQATAAFAVLLGATMPGLAATAWLLGNALLTIPGAGRVLGIACLLGLPGTTGFFAYASASEALRANNLLDIALLMLRAGSLAMLTFALLRFAAGDRTPAALITSARRELFPDQRQIPALALLAAHALIFGIVGWMLGTSSLIDTAAAMQPISWISLASGILLGAGLWRINSASGRSADALPRADALLSNVEDAFAPVFAALDRARNSFGAALALIQSDGALLLAGLALIIAVLVSGQTTP
ncbi:MAG: hypothetical protein NTZ50_11635 [Chloroflexi bacterium]|nr:hypothetical protein [Chloroflexota bacterium]